MVSELVTKVHKVLNEVKDFDVGYSSDTMANGYMLIEYKGKRYAVKAVEISNPSESIFEDIDQTQYYV